MICGVISVCLLIRTVVSPPEVVVGRTADDLKAFLCKTDWWDYTFTSSKYSLINRSHGQFLINSVRNDDGKKFCGNKDNFLACRTISSFQQKSGFCLKAGNIYAPVSVFCIQIFFQLE